jgi:hypothetical protein
LESLSEKHLIDLYYSDESRVWIEPSISYDCQFPDKEVSIPSAKGGGLNCFALLTGNNQCLIETSQETITSQFIFEPFEDLLLKLKRLTVVVLDKARIHTSRIIKERLKV